MSSLPPSGGPIRNVRRSSAPPPPPAAPSEPPEPVVVKAVTSKPPKPVSIAPRGPRKPSKIVPVLRALVGLIMIVGIGAGVVWGARKYVRTSARFSVSEIVTAGGKRRGSEEIAVIAGISKGQNVFSIDLERARAKLAADPWIESAEISRQLPGTITIRVTEREAAGLVAMPEGTYLVTRDGAIIKRVDAGDPLELHIVTGVTLKQLVDDREGATRTIRKALDLALDYDRSPLAQRSPLEEVHVETTGDMTLVCGKSGVVVRMGGAPYKRKLDQAVRIVAELDRRGAKPDTIMLDDEARPDRVVVRMR
jgi:cell division protein FtsQ